jgi:prepilin-type N-terminal cleavage/methylation domain-containing protein
VALRRLTEPWYQDFIFQGFTLVELLIALIILGEIATFTIPKVISSQQNGRFNAVAKEVAAMASNAYQQLQLSNGASTNTTVGDLTPYMNYVAFDTGGVTTVDDVPTYPSLTCGPTRPCLKLHNGAVMTYNLLSLVGPAQRNSILM